jgi:hypothetical protein
MSNCMLKPAAMLGNFPKTRAGASKPARKDRPSEAANPSVRDYSPWFPAIPGSEYFNRLHRVENQSQS